jgi:hypothetical protein
MAETFKPLATACVDQEENLVLLHYGELAGIERQALQKHLASCGRCQSFLQDLGRLLPLARATDDPPSMFWSDYDRELRKKLDDVAKNPTWRQRLAAYFQPRAVPVFATAAIVALTLTFTVGRGLWLTPDPARDKAPLLEVMPVAENLEFFRAMDVLDELDLLEDMGNQGSAA